MSPHKNQGGESRRGDRVCLHPPIANVFFSMNGAIRHCHNSAIKFSVDTGRFVIITTILENLALNP